MNAYDFFKPTKGKIIYLIMVGLIILILGIAAQDVRYCIRAPCDQSTSAIISQKIYPLVSFNFSYINTRAALAIKNLLNPSFSAGAAYLFISLIVGLLLHYSLICFIFYLHRLIVK